MAVAYPSNAPILEYWLNGIYTSTMFVTLWLIFYGKRERRTPRALSIAVAMVLVPWICSTIQVACSWHWFTSAINDNEDPTGGGAGLRFSLTHIPPWVAGVADTFFVTNIFLADAVFVWRAWTVWNRRWVVVILPAAAAVAGLVIGGLLVQYQVAGSQAGTPAIAAKFAHKFVSLSTVYFSLSVATSLSTTLLIATRIILVQRQTRQHLGRKAFNFNPIIEILIESAAIYSATLIIFVAFDVNKSPNLVFAQDVHSQMAGLAPLLIILRIFAGKSRPREDWSRGITGEKTSSIEFAPSRSTLVTSQGRDPEQQMSQTSGSDHTEAKNI